jgi:Phosphotransferase enzyme family
MSQMSGRPAAEVHIDSELVRALLRKQHADIAELTLEKVAAGWDNVTFRLGPEMAVRLPRRSASVVMLEHEQRWIPTIANHLPLSVPSPLRIGQPSDQYPWPWSILPWLKGEAADLVPVKADQAKPLAHRDGAVCNCRLRMSLRHFHWLLHNDIERDHEAENDRKEVDRQRSDVGCGAVLEPY